MKPIRLGLLGCGTVGTGVARIVAGHQEDLQRQIGAPVVIEKVLVRNIEKERNIPLERSRLTDNARDILDHPEIDIVVEVMGGTELAKQYIEAAIVRGKHIVTANKDLMAMHGAEILRLARENRVDVFYEASVAGGIPIIRTIIDGFSSDRIKKMMGIVNGTTNYILSKMSREGASYEEVLKEAQQLGYAEADPTSDVDGLDAAYKMVILATLGFRTPVAISDVYVQGIRGVSPEDILYGQRLGYEMKLLGIAEEDDGLISVSVQPTLVRKTHPLASVHGVYNAVYVYGEAVGETMFFGPGAGEMPTATSVVADIVAIGKNMLAGVTGRNGVSPYRQKRLKTDEQICSKYFILLHVDDKAGVLATIAQAFARCNVSIESVLQQPVARQPHAEIIVITHDTSRASIDCVLDVCRTMDVVKKIKSVYRVEG